MKLTKTISAVVLAVAAVSVPLCVYASSAGAYEQIAQDTPVVKVSPGAISIEIPGDAQRHVAIYALTGQVVKQANLNPGQNTIELPAGYYIVRIGHYSVKVVVK